MELSQYLQIARRWWWALLLAPVIGAGAAYGVSTQIAPTYEATTTLLVVQRQAEGTVQLNDLQTSERLANTFSRLVTIRPVLERAIEDGDLGLDVVELRRRISVSNPRSTQLLEVSADAGDPETAAHRANTVSEAFIGSNQAALSSRPGAVSIVEQAEPPLSPVSPRKTLNAALGGMLALMAVGGLVLLVEYLDDTVKSSEGIAEMTGLPTLGRVGHFEKPRSPRDQLLAGHRPRSAYAEAYRAARTALTQAQGLQGEHRVALVTSANPREGKTTTTANLAVVLGLAGHRVCVVDTDLRNPMQHRLFGLENSAGVTTLLLSREMDVEQAIQRSVFPNVSVIAAGPIPPNPSELLGSASMQRMVEALRGRFDFLLMDSPPALAVTDASVIATLVDATVLVVRAGKTRTAALRETLEELALSGRPIAGVMLNDIAPRHAGRYYAYGKGYGRPYGQPPEDDVPQVRPALEPNGHGSEAVESGAAERGLRER